MGYLFAEPGYWPDGGVVTASQFGRHRSEIQESIYGSVVGNDEVMFYSLSYSEVISPWSRCASPPVQSHAAALRAYFYL
jgi:hypothetical protein